MKNKYNITEETKEEVKILLQKEKRVVIKERLTAINMYINGMTQKKIAEVLGRNRGYVIRAVKNYFTKGIVGLEEKRGGDRRSELSEEKREELKRIINNSYPINMKGWSGKLIAELIEHKYGIKYKLKTLYPILKRMNLTYKKAKKIDPKKSEEKIDTWKEDIKFF